jgi:hypothetical protein
MKSSLPKPKEIYKMSRTISNRSKSILHALVDAEDDARRRELMPKAVAIHGEVFKLLAFMISAWSKSDSERELLLRLVNYDAREAFAPNWRAVQIVIGNKRGVNPDLVCYDPDCTESPNLGEPSSFGDNGRRRI